MIVPILIVCTLFVSSSAEPFARSGGDCLDTLQNEVSNRWSTPLVKIDNKYFYFGTFFKASWFQAMQYCRYHGMDLASISSKEENEALKLHIEKYDLPLPLWFSGTDLDKEGTYIWLGNGRSFTYTDWHPNNPDNWVSPTTNVSENCSGFWKNKNGLKWNDMICSSQYYFICETQ